jgi:multidrug transporter EmrE-like cation transporter
MSVPEIIALSTIEIIGDFALKNYANKGGLQYLTMGIVGYIGVVGMLIVSLKGSTILMVNGAWDGISTILESLAAYIILGERFEHFIQYVGLVFIVVGLYLLKIPWIKGK